MRPTPNWIIIADDLLKAADNPSNSSGWVDRMALIMEEAGIPRRTLSYDGAPQTVARAWAQQAELRGQMESLKTVIQKRLSTPAIEPPPLDRQHRLEALASKLKEMGRSDADVDLLVTTVQCMSQVLEEELALLERRLRNLEKPPSH